MKPTFQEGAVARAGPRRLSRGLAVTVLALGALAAGIASFSGCQQIELLLADSEGQRLWIKHCDRCHGYDGAGNTPQAIGNPRADLTDDYWVYGSDRPAIEQVIRSGVFGEMPAFEDLSPEELKALVFYIRELRGERKPR